jgi:hypothetical protein
MADNKEIRISTKLDTSQFDAQIKSMEEKFKNLQKTTSQSQKTANNVKNDPIFGAPASKIYEQSQKQLLEYSSQVTKEMEKQQKIGANSINRLREEIKLEKEKVKINKEQLENNEKLLQSEEHAQRARVNLFSNIKNRINTPSQENAPSQENIPNTPNTPNQNQGGGNGFAMFSSIVKGLGVAALIKGAMNATVKFAEHRIERDTKLLSDKASASTVAAQGIHEIVSGRGGSQAYWANERESSLNMAMQRQSNVSNLDAYKGVGKVGAAGLAGGIAGGTLGAMAGSALSFATMGIAAPVTPYLIAGGATLGASLAGGATIASDKRSYNRFFDKDAYNAMSSKEAMESYQGNLLAKKGRDPWKSIGEEKYYSDYSQQILTGRSMGLDTAGMLGNPDVTGVAGRKGQASKTMSRDQYGEWHEAQPYLSEIKEIKGKAGTSGYLQQGLNQFSPETMARQAAGLSGSSTDMMQYGRTRAAIVERQFNLGNAASLFGEQGKVGVSAEQSDKNIDKILSDAVGKGVDKSKIASMPQELQRFTQSVMEMATSTGGYSSKISQQMAAALGSETPTVAGIEASKTAVEEFNDKARSRKGFEGQIGFANIHKMLPGVTDPDLYNALNTTSASDYSAMPKNMQEALARQAKTDVAGLSKLFSKNDSDKQSQSSGQDKANLEVQEYEDKYPGIRSNPEKYSSDVTEKFDDLKSRAQIIEKGRSGSEMSWIAASQKVNLKAASLGGKFSSETFVDPIVEGMRNRATDPNALAKESADGKSELAKLNAERNQMSSLTKASQSFTENTAAFLHSYDKFSQAIMHGATGLDTFAESLRNVVKALNGTGSMPATTKIAQPVNVTGGLPGTKPYDGPMVK